MLVNYLKIAWRNFRKHKFYTITNILGLSVGVACTLMIFLYVQNETNYDEFHEDYEKIYRANRHILIGENEYHFAVGPAPFARALQEEMPEVELAVRLRDEGSFMVKTLEMESSFKERYTTYADSGFFDLFTFPLVHGDPKVQLKAPNTLAISEKTAKKYFPEESAIGKTLVLGSQNNYTVTGVFEDMPENSHLQLDLIISMSTLGNVATDNQWTSNNFYTYFRTKEPMDTEVLTSKVNHMANKHVEPFIINYLGKTMEELEAEGDYMRFGIQPLDEIYLTSDFTFDIGLTGNKTYTLLFGAIAVFIIILACINFMNLSTARSANRAKEVGVRKVLGSFQVNLVYQFLTESILLSLISFVIGFLLVIIALPFFNELAGRALQIPENDIVFLAGFLLSALVVGILAGLYPAFYLSSFKPVHTLKGKLSIGVGNSNIRSGLVVFQFFISILLIIGTVAIYKQLNYIQNKNIGFNKDQVIMMHDTYMLNEQTAAFKQQVDQLANVKSSTYTGFLPIGGYYRSDNTFWKLGEEPTQDNVVGMQLWSVDNDYISTMGMQLKAGRNFREDKATDSSGVILNEKAFEMYGFTDINAENYIQTYVFDEQTREVVKDQFEVFKVIGLVEDFHYESLKESIGPVGLFLRENAGVYSIRVNTEDFASTLANIERIWDDLDAGVPFSYSFMDEDFAQMYHSEKKLGQIFALFSGLAIFIGCLGLFALASFMAEQRSKEIGVRKVLGASVSGIVIMLSKQFSKLVFWAFLLAIPVAWWGISNWLDSYNYKISIGVDLFAIAGLLAFAIAWITVSYQSFRAAVSDPVKSLKSE